MVSSYIEDVAQLNPTLDAETQPDAVKEQQEQDKADRGARTAENVRYGQTISEGGIGGKTTEAGGSANQGSLSLCSTTQLATRLDVLLKARHIDRHLR